MTVICGVAAARPRDELEHECRSGIEAQSLYSRRSPRILTVDGASFGAALFETTPENMKDSQPLTAGSTLLAADARLDNRAEILTALGDRSLDHSCPDSQIILAGWLRWKCALFERLIGSFAVAIFESSDRRVILARGPSSDRPLNYSNADGLLRFASMPSGLLAGQRFAPDLVALSHFIVKGDYALGETAFADARAVLPGHFLDWTADGHRQVRFWHPPAVDKSRTRSVVEEFRHILDESVACRLRRIDGPVASHLSAGFDSSAITATAAAAERDKIIGYTMTPTPGAALSVPRRYVVDEAPAAADTARMLGIRHKVVSHSGPLLDCLKGHARYYQAPVPNVPNHGWGHAIYEQAVEAGARVLLSGAFGNATVSFGGIDVLSEWLSQGRLMEYFLQSRALVRSGAARWRGTIFYSLDTVLPWRLWNALSGSLPVTARHLFIRPGWMRRVENDSIGSDYDVPGLRKSQYDMYAGTDYGMFFKATLGKLGLDERDPTADQRLIEFGLRLPAEQYLNDGVTRRLAREGLADRLPRSIIDHQIRGYQGADWFAKFRAQDAREWIEEISASSTAPELLDLPRMLDDLANLPRIAALAPSPLRQWGQRFTRALAVGAFLRQSEQEFALLGRRC